MSIGIHLSCPICGADASGQVGWNLTYNLRPMWREAGLDWDELEGKPGEDCLGILTAVVDRLALEPEKFKKLNPPNGWGTYENLLGTLTELRDACQQFPNHTLHTYR